MNIILKTNHFDYSVFDQIEKGNFEKIDFELIDIKDPLYWTVIKKFTFLNINNISMAIEEMNKSKIFDQLQSPLFSSRIDENINLYIKYISYITPYIFYLVDLNCKKFSLLKRHVFLENITL